MSNFNKKEHRKIRKQRSKEILGSSQKPRVVISKSNRYLTAQAFNDASKENLAYLCTRELTIDLNFNDKSNFSKKSKKFAEILGSEFAKLLSKKNITKIVFDRNGYIYHGKIKSFCEEMRRLGIDF